MASLLIHMAIGQEYCKKNKVNNEEEFLWGNISPDFEDKITTHYSSKQDSQLVKDWYLNKVNLYEFCKNNTIDNELYQGKFLHLLTDYLFYAKYMPNMETFRTLEELPKEQSTKYLYTDYYRVNSWIYKNYPFVQTDKVPDFSKVPLDEPMVLFEESGLKYVIEYCASIDLNKVFNKILENKASDIFEDFKY